MKQTFDYNICWRFWNSSEQQTLILRSRNVARTQNRTRVLAFRCRRCEMNTTDRNNASFAYSVGLLKMLLEMQLITKEEYKKIVRISAAHYDAEKICV